MANKILIKRGLEANRTGFTPAEGELVYTTDEKKLYIGDGVTVGGVVVTDNNYTDIDLAKLAAIEENATADQTKADIDALGIDAATVNNLTVETAVPSGAVFTDTVYDDSDVLKDSDALTAVTAGNKLVTESDIASFGGGDMVKATYDTNDNGIVDNAEKVNNLTVETAVPAGAVFTDTTYSSSDFVLDDLSNVTITANSNGELLTWNGTAWVNQTITEAGVQPAGSYVTTTDAQALHATDALSITGNVLYLNKADGTNETVDLSIYLDDTNLARIVSGTYVTDEPGVGDKSLKFVRDDASVFYIDASMFFDDTNLVTSVAGKTGAVTLVEADISDFGSYEPADATILKDADIGVTVQAYDANTVSDPSYVHTDNNYTTTEKTKLAGIEASATADQTDAEIETAYNNQVSVVTQLEAETGTSTTVRRWTAERVKQAILSLAVSVVNLAVGTRDATSLVITNDAGDNVTLPVASITEAGLLSATDKVRIENLNETDWDTAFSWGDHSTAGYSLSSHLHDDRYLQLTGGTVSGTITATNIAATSNGTGTAYKVGDDAFIGDVNTQNTLNVRGVQNSDRGYISFGNTTGQLGRIGSGALTWTGNEIYHAGNTGTSVTYDVTTSSTDTTAGRLLKVGDFGVGRVNAITITNLDLSQPTQAGFALLGTTSGSFPDSQNAGLVLHLNRGSDSQFSQLFFSDQNQDAGSNKVYFRSRDAIDFTGGWKELYHTGNTGNVVTYDVGPGNGLDADTVDGTHLSGITLSGDAGNGDLNNSYWSSASRMTSANVTANGPGTGWYMIYNNRHRGGTGDGTNYGTQLAIGMNTDTGNAYFRSETGTDTWTSWRKIWNDANDGSGSGLDADTVDGIQGSSIALKPADHTTNNSEYSLVWENNGGTLYTSTAHLKYNPALKRITAGALLLNSTTDNMLVLDSTGHANIIIDRGTTTYDNNILFKTGGTLTWRLWQGAGDEKISFRRESTGLDPLTVYEDGIHVLNNGTVWVGDKRGGLSGSGAVTELTSVGNLNIIADTDAASTGEVLTLQAGVNKLQIGSNGNTTSDELTYNGSKVWHSSNDGSGSGLDADKLDGQEGSYYLNASNLNAGTINDARLPATITSNITGNAATATTATKLATARTLSLTGDVTGSVTFDGSTNATITATVADNSHNHNFLTDNSTITYGASHFQVCDISGQTGTGGNGSTPYNPTSDWYHHLISNHGNSNGYYADLALCFNTNNHYITRMTGGTRTTVKLWNDGNDGSGSGLDADLLDGVQGSSFLRSDAADTATGKLTLSGGLEVTGVDWNDGLVRISGGSPNIEFDQTDGMRWQIGANGSAFYILDDTNDDGAFEGTPYPFELNSNGTLKIDGNTVLHEGNLSSFNLGGLTVVTTTSNVTASPNSHVIFTTGGRTLTLPSTAATGDVVKLSVLNSTNCVINRNGMTISYVSENLVMDIPYSAVTLVWNGVSWVFG